MGVEIIPEDKYTRSVKQAMYELALMKKSENPASLVCSYMTTFRRQDIATYFVLDKLLFWLFQCSILTYKIIGIFFLLYSQPTRSISKEWAGRSQIIMHMHRTKFFGAYLKFFIPLSIFLLQIFNFNRPDNCNP